MKYFKYEEFDQPGLPGSGERFMDRDLLGYIDQLRAMCGFPIVISSGYRSPEYNAKISDTGETGPHTTGKAVDIEIARGQAYILLDHVFTMGVFTGIGIQQKGESRFIHLDILPGAFAQPRPTIWSY